jgi:hypothetical protein
VTAVMAKEDVYAVQGGGGVAAVSSSRLVPLSTTQIDIRV